MPIWQAVVLGIVQGLGEFLPISSSAHLALVPWLFGWDDPGLAFDVALHWGTLAGVLAYFWRDWITLIRAGLASLRDRSMGDDPDRRIFWSLVVSTVPAAIIGKLLDRWAENTLRAPVLIAATLSVMGIILWIADRVGSKALTIRDMTVGRAIAIGFAQAAALVPGVSRSGATISVGLFQGFDRASIARFSFLMSTPIILGAGALKLPAMFREMRGPQGYVTWGALIAGFLAAAVVGTAVIAWLLDYLRRRTYVAFAVYRLALALVVVLVWMARR